MNLIATIGRHFGVQTGHPPLAPAPKLDGDEAIALLIVDALGFNQLQRHLADGDLPFLADRLRSGEATCHALTTVFPSTTAVALPSLHTGAVPAEHGSVGYTVWLPEDGVVAELIRFWDLATDRPLAAPDRFATVSAFYRRLADAGTASAVVGPALHRGSALNRWLFDGATYLGYDTANTVPTLMADALASGRRRYAVAYWPGYDAVCHHAGPRSAQAGDEAAAVDLAIARLARVLGGRGPTLLLVAADHGQRELDPAEAILLHEDRRLAAWLTAPPAGERCGRFLRVAPDATAAVVDHLAPHADVAPMDHLWADGLFGGPPARPNFRARTGDLLAIPRGRRQLEFAFKPTDRGRFFRGGHGGWTADEMLVPLVTLPLGRG